MRRRKLSERQREIIRQRQQQRLARARAGAESERDDADLGPEQHGTVVAHYGANLHVDDGHGDVVLCSARSNLGELVCGDEVVWRAAADGGVVVALAPRRTLLVRSDVYGKMKPVAANVDRMLVVVAPVPEVSENLLDGYLVAAELCAIEPVIVVNKCDLLTDAARAAWEQRMGVYRRIGYRVLFVSTRRDGGAAGLATELSGRTAIVVGHSGVGKSSLLKTLLPDADIAIGDVSAAGLGKHTTTVARLYRLPGGGRVIDSPGVRDFKLGHIEARDAQRGYAEFRPFLGHCRFGDCTHTVEPGCALIAAAQRGAIDAARLLSYQRLYATLRDETARSKGG
jgi:ribosome biogenesis GTPase